MFFLCFSLFGPSTVDVSKFIGGNYSVVVSGSENDENFNIRQISNGTYAIQKSDDEVIEIQYNWVDKSTLHFDYEETSFDLNFTVSSYLEAKGTFGNYFVHVTSTSSSNIHVVVLDISKKLLFNIDFNKTDVAEKKSNYLLMGVMIAFFLGSQFLSRKFAPQMQQVQQKKAQTPKVTEVKEGEEKVESENKEAAEETNAEENKNEKPAESEGKVE